MGHAINRRDCFRFGLGAAGGAVGAVVAAAVAGAEPIPGATVSVELVEGEGLVEEIVARLKADLIGGADAVDVEVVQTVNVYGEFSADPDDVFYNDVPWPFFLSADARV